LESYKRIKWFLEKKNDSFNIKTFDELLSLLNVKDEEEFACNIYQIFGKYTRVGLILDRDEFYYKFANYIINYKESISILAFYRMENIHDKLSCKKILKKFCFECFLIYILIKLNFQVIFDAYTHLNETYVDMENVLNPFVKFIFNFKRDINRLQEIFYKFNLSKAGKVTKNELLDFCLESDEIQEIFYKNFNNTEEIDNIYEEEINISCNNNLKKSK